MFKRSGITPVHCRVGGRRSASPTTRNILISIEKKLLNRSITQNYSKHWKLHQVKNKCDMKLEEKLSLKDNLKLTELTEKKHLNRIY